MAAVVDLHNPLRGSRGRRSFSDLRHPGLLVVDVQRLFCDPQSPLYVPGWATAQSKLLQLLRHFRDLGQPIVLTRHAHAVDDDGGLMGRFFNQLLRDDDPLASLLPEILALAPDAPVLTKAWHSAFRHPDLARHFAGCDAVVIVGVQTPLCVLASAVDAARFAFVPIVVSDACAAKDSVVHEAALLSLAQGHAHVASTQEILQTWAKA